MRVRTVLLVVVALAGHLCACGGGGSKGLRYRIDDTRLSGVPAEQRSAALTAQTNFIKAQQRYRQASENVQTAKKELEQASAARTSAEAAAERARKERDQAREKGDAAARNETSRKLHIAELELRAAELHIEFATAQIEVARVEAEAAEAEMFAMEARYEEQKALLLRGKQAGDYNYQDFELQRQQRVEIAQHTRNRADQHQGSLKEKKHAWTEAVREVQTATGKGP